MMRSHRVAGIAFGAALLGMLVALSASALSGRGAPLTPDQRVRDVAGTLRCPVCLNLSVADSPSPVAQEMRARIRQELLAGKSPDAIRAEFIAAYGEWILLSPRPSGVNLLAWVLPPFLLVGALIGLLFLVRRWTASLPPRDRAVRPLSADERNRLEAELAQLGEAP